MRHTGVLRAASELSIRGRAFLAAGLTAAICAFVLGQPALLGAGFFAITVPLVSLIALRTRHFEIHVRRRMEPTRVFVGQSTRIRLDLACVGSVPRRRLLLEDSVPYGLGPRARMVVRGIGPGTHTEVGYEVRSDARGRYALGPLRIHVRDAYGMVDLVREFARADVLTVRPKISRLPRIPLRGGSGAGVEEHLRSSLSGSTEDVTVREYRRGDDLRRVHWRTTARTGELMVRREEDPVRAHATVLIDNRQVAHSGTSVGSSLERAIEFAGSVCTHLVGEGYTVDLVDADGTRTHGDPVRHVDAAPLLDALAVIGMSERRDLDAVVDPISADQHVVVAVLGAELASQTSTLSALKRRGSSSLAVVLDVGRWPSSASGDTEAPAWLRRQEWRATVLGPQDSDAAVWQRLARRAHA